MSPVTWTEVVGVRGTVAQVVVITDPADAPDGNVI